MIRALAIVGNLGVAIYWGWGALHELSVGGGANWLSVGFVGLATLSVASLILVRQRALRIGVMVANVLATIWWVGLATAMPALSVYQAFWSLFALTAVATITALTLGGARTRTRNA